jgi:hypothetical protein
VTINENRVQLGVTTPGTRLFIQVGDLKVGVRAQQKLDIFTLFLIDLRNDASKSQT